MPTFYPRQMPRHLPLTPPEFIPSYNGSNACSNQYQQQAGYGGQSRYPEERSYGYSERYDQTQLPPVQSAVVYQHQQRNEFHSNSGASYYEPLNMPILPPMRGPEQRPNGDMDLHSHASNVDARANQGKEEKPTGGVSAKLDYELEMMSDFVSEMAQGIIQQGRPSPSSFRKWVHGVLCATRLPSATILLGLHYLSQRMSQISKAGQQGSCEINIHRFLTLGLLLGSKFLDDNTFINRSWCEVSGIPVTDLNQLETEWLAAFEFRLHRDPAEAGGFTTWQQHWKEFEASAIARANRQNKLAPIDTAVQQWNVKSFVPSAQRNNFNKQLPTPEFKHAQSQYTPAYSHYDPWSARSTQDHSPASSAPYTGPTTPEYYGNSTTWAPPEGYSRRTMFGFPPASQVVTPAQNQHATFGTSCYPQNPQYNIYHGHPLHCNCFHCGRHPSSYMNMGYATQPVAG